MVEYGVGEAMISLGLGSWKFRLISAWPLFRDLRWKLAGLPCLQKLVTWENRCWAKHWPVGVYCVLIGAILERVRDHPPSLSPPSGSLQSLKEGYQAWKLGCIDPL